MWARLLKRYWQVSMIKDSPANTPHSLFLLCVVTMAYYVITLLQWTITDYKNQYTLGHSLIAGLFLLLSFFIYTLIVLYFHSKSNRFVQTTTSLLMAILIIQILAFPILFINTYLIQHDIKDLAMLLLAGFSILGLLILSIWQFLAIAHIYRCALEVSFFVAIFTSMGLLAANILTVSLLH